MGKPKLSKAAKAAIKSDGIQRAAKANEARRVAGVKRSGIKKGDDLNPPRGVIK